MVHITVSRSAGFCFGVNRAVNMVYQALAEGKSVATLGPIIHNKDVVGSMVARGARIIEDVSELREGEYVVIRSHGVGRAVYEEIRRRGNPVIDATCPFVARIHRTCLEQTAAGRFILIAGDETHPEVQGIVGHCDENYFVFRDEFVLKDFFANNPPKKLAILAQTTYNSIIWEKCLQVLPKDHPDIVVFDTICTATEQRQHDSAALAAASDLMVVIGGRHSSNTVKLYDICAAYCRTYHIENADELDTLDLGDAKKIGITAGASTPAHIIKEVVAAMEDRLNMEGEQVTEDTATEDTAAEETTAQENAEAEDAGTEAEAESTEAVSEETSEEAPADDAAKSEDEIDFAQAVEETLNKLHRDDKVRGTVVSFNSSEVLVDIDGAKQTGTIPANELSSDPAKKPSDLVQVGDVLDLIVIKVSDQDGIATLSKKRVDEQAGLQKIAEAKESGEILTGKVSAVIKGGVNIYYQGVRVFIPASQTGLPRDSDLESLKDQEVRFVIIEAPERRKSAVGSIKAVTRREKAAAREKFWETAEIGKEYEGEVKSLTSYGAFVDLGGIDGMVHISELSWKRIRHPNQVVSVGDVLKVYIKDLDREKERISLGYKREEDNPWAKFLAEFAVGDVVTAKIVSITSFGAFAQLIDGVDGLIHISQLADRHVEDVQDVVNVGDEVRVKITNIDQDKKRISLSMREVADGGYDGESF